MEFLAEIKLNTMNLLELNNDCILAIFRFIPVSTLLNFLGVISQRMDEMVLLSITRFKEFNMNFREGCIFTTKQLRILGKHLTIVNISVGYSMPTSDVLQILHPITITGCESNIKDLTLHYITFDTDYLHCLSLIALNLLKVDLSFCQLTDELLGPLLGQCQHLRELQIIGNYTLFGESLRCKTVANLCRLVVELHENWKIDLSAYKFTNRDILCKVFDQGRRTYTEFLCGKSTSKDQK